MPPASSRSSSPSAPASYASATRSSAPSRSRVRTSMRMKARTGLLALAWLPGLLAMPGCSLGHAAAGQLRLLAARRPIDAVIADPATPEDLRERLALAPQARELARDLGLEVGGQYTSYVAWPGDRVVTAVVATRPGEVEPSGFWFPIVRYVPYKGFFDPARAHGEADRLRGAGSDR